jgi:hypothetical protein
MTDPYQNPFTQSEKRVGRDGEVDSVRPVRLSSRGMIITRILAGLSALRPWHQALAQPTDRSQAVRRPRARSRSRSRNSRHFLISTARLRG